MGKTVMLGSVITRSCRNLRRSTPYWSWIIASIACLMPLCGQTLRLSSASASRGDQITIEFGLESPAGKEPLALQWETKIPAAVTAAPIDDKSLSIAVLQDTGKSLHCAVQQQSDQSYTSKCILAGGQNPIPDGPICRLKLRIPMNAPIGEAHIRVENTKAVSRDMKEISLPPADTVVMVRK